MLNWGKKDVKDLEAEVKVANDQVVIERQARIEAEIALSKRDATFASEREDTRAAHEVEVARLNREIEVLNSDRDDAVNSIVTEKIANLEKEASDNRIRTRKELRTEFGVELEALKKANKTLTDENSKNKGLYDGALLVIKSLETQLAAANKLTTTLVEAMPEVKANLTAGNQNVSVNAKS